MRRIVGYGSYGAALLVCLVLTGCDPAVFDSLNMVSAIQNGTTPTGPGSVPINLSFSGIVSIDDAGNLAFAANNIQGNQMVVRSQRGANGSYTHAAIAVQGQAVPGLVPAAQFDDEPDSFPGISTGEVDYTVNLSNNVQTLFRQFTPVGNVSTNPITTLDNSFNPVVTFPPPVGQEYVRLSPAPKVTSTGISLSCLIFGLPEPFGSATNDNAVVERNSTTGAVRSLANTVDTAPGTGLKFGKFLDVQRAGSQTAFLAQTVNANNTPAKVGIYLHNGTTLRKLVEVGDTAPGGNGTSTFTVIVNQSLTMSIATNPGNTTSTFVCITATTSDNRTGLYEINSAGAPKLIIDTTFPNSSGVGAPFSNFGPVHRYLSTGSLAHPLYLFTAKLSTSTNNTDVFVIDGTTNLTARLGSLLPNGSTPLINGHSFLYVNGVAGNFAAIRTNTQSGPPHIVVVDLKDMTGNFPHRTAAARMQDQLREWLPKVAWPW